MNAQQQTDMKPVRSTYFPKLYEFFFVFSSLSILLSICHFMFSEYFPNANGRLGHDYSLFLPQLLAGYFWYRVNGLFAIPWFTPAFCGGVPLMPHPESLYYSLLQFLTFVIDPLSSVYLAFLAFAGIGFVGFYVLLRYAFFTGRFSALFGATLFLFNGFYLHRMLIGHLSRHSYMFLALAAFFLLRPITTDKERRPWQLLFDAAICGLLGVGDQERFLE